MKTKTKKSKPVKVGRVTFVSVSRLSNLGNYQNIKFDLSAEVAKGDSATETFRRLAMVLQDMRPISPPSCLASFDAARKKMDAERTEYENAHWDEWSKEISGFNEHRRRQLDALHALDDLGGHSLFKDAKNTWDNNDDFIF
jgi:hypothetical protein